MIQSLLDTSGHRTVTSMKKKKTACFTILPTHFKAKTCVFVLLLRLLGGMKLCR